MWQKLWYNHYHYHFGRRGEGDVFGLYVCDLCAAGDFAQFDCAGDGERKICEV